MTEMEAGQRRYAVFISYSHQEEKLAAWLHRTLEAYRTPRSLAGKPGAHRPVPKKLGRCFRDRAELAASDDLAREIREALDNSDALIVLCSPRAAASRYVEEEIRYFKSLGRGDRILAAISDGEPHAAGKSIGGRTLTEADECFPRALLNKVTESGAISHERETSETIAADFRKQKDEREAGKLKLLAGLLGVGLDDLVQRERAAARRRVRLFAYATIAFAGLAIAAVLFALEAVRQRGIADAQTRQAQIQLQISEARRIAGEAQLALSRAADFERLAGAGHDPNSVAYAVDAEYIRYEAGRASERAALLSLESLNTFQTEEGEVALRQALALLRPVEVRRGLNLDALVGWSPDGNSLIFYGEGPPHVALNLQSGALSPATASPGGGDWGAAIIEGAPIQSPDRRYNAIASEQNPHALELHAAGGSEPRMLEHEWTPSRAAFSPDSRYLVTLTGQVSMDAADPGAEALPGSAIRVFETGTGRLVFHVSLAQDGGVGSSALSPDTGALATQVSAQLGRGGAVIWTLWPEEARAEACRSLSRNLARSEWDNYVRTRPFAETCPGLPAVED